MNKEYPKTLSTWLEQFDWNYFVTFTTPYYLSLRSARRLMERFWSRSTKTYPGNNQCLFWVAERFECRQGYHIHGLFLSNAPYKLIIDNYQIVTGSKKEGEWSLIELRNYCPKLKGEKYCLKDLLKRHSDYDFYYYNS
jgi:hypothetical protein